MNRNEIRKNVGFSVLRRDFRQAHSDPEVDTTKAKRKRNGNGKRIDHKHVWIETEESAVRNVLVRDES